MTVATLSTIGASLCSDLETVRPLFMAVPSRGCLVSITIQTFSDMKNDDTDLLKLPVELPVLWSTVFNGNLRPPPYHDGSQFTPLAGSN